MVLQPENDQIYDPKRYLARTTPASGPFSHDAYVITYNQGAQS